MYKYLLIIFYYYLYILLRLSRLDIWSRLYRPDNLTQVCVLVVLLMFCEWCWFMDAYTENTNISVCENIKIPLDMRSSVVLD